MKEQDKRYKTYCVWNNLDDSIVAIDLPLTECIKLMRVTRNSFYSYVSRGGNGLWTVLESSQIKEDEE